ncbi:L-aspartate oxidase [Brachybacterium sp. FME24]|uniref:L-aspartate oxidase n=1 Tax=Brachybacterium sp. FME24 TaxID=2742605 RepID=UPI001867C713|nr:L-aspartate oxidase [Brachybacterium sp. FME24]
MAAKQSAGPTADHSADLPIQPVTTLDTDVLVIGSGIAGLTAALRASQRADVLLVTKSELSEASTRYAQGGIAGAVDPDDHPADHAQDTLAAGAGLCDEDAVRVLCEEGPEAIRDLINHGVGFDRIAGPVSPYALCLEGAHSRPRILHAGGDATGRAIQQALVAALRERGITVREHTALVDLRLEGGRVVGAELMTAGGERVQVRASATLLATGGAGQIFAHTTNPQVATGDGIAAAWRAGAALEDLEFYQFHPTALAAPGTFLISEAVRGEGAMLRDEHGRRFLPALDPRAELAPRDVVARAIAEVMAGQDGRPVLLDATGIGAQRLRERFPTIDAAVRAAGVDWGSQPVPVTPAAHYWMGGIRTDLAGRTTLPGLLAAGECARTGVHGANRLASNSLLEGAVFGARAGATAVDLVLPGSSVAPSEASTGAGCAASPDRAQRAHHAPVDTAAPAGRAADRASRVSVGPGASEQWTRDQLQELMWSHAGLLRTGGQLDAAAARLAEWRTPDPAALSTVRELEDRNLLDLARLLAAHALARPGSVGAHHRLDAPVSVVDSAQEALAC